MTKKLRLGMPVLSVTSEGRQHVVWYLLGKGGRGFYISWLEKAPGTGRPECMAFKVGRRPNRSSFTVNWRGRAVSHNPDAALALEEVAKQLTELYDVVVSVGDPASALRPGEVVSDAQ